MTKEEFTELGIKSQAAKDAFNLACQENTAIGAADRAEQIARYERLRAEMHEAMNAHHRALGVV